MPGPAPFHTDERDLFLGYFTMRADETLADVIAAVVAVGEETTRVIRGVDDLGQRVPVPPGVPWFPDDLEAWSVRWVLVHLVSEMARHAGHADIVREAIDGATAFPPWLQPWERA